MAQERNFSESAGTPNRGESTHQSQRIPDGRWVVRWTLLTTAAIPAALILAPPFAAVILGFVKFGANKGLWSGEYQSGFAMAGFITSFALTLATAQWYMLRVWLPRAGVWFAVTLAGVLLGGLIAWAGLTNIPSLGLNLIWGRAVLVLLAGAGIGLVQWLYLQKIVPHARWIILIDALAAGSIALSGDSITSWIELLVILLLPGTITGIGLALLLKQLQLDLAESARVLPIHRERPRLPRLARFGLGVIALVPLFFACIWLYAASQLALAKNEGIYASPEEAIIARNSQGWGGASVIKLEDIQASPNSHDGTLPHVWFGGATVYLDRVPEGGRRSQYSTGSFYLHVRDGWVYLPEGAFPGFIGWVMELYNLEGVNEWDAAKLVQ